MSITRARLHEIIFEADTPAGKFYDVSLILAIAISVIVVMLDSVSSIKKTHGTMLYSIEWFFTILFSLEYTVRLLCVKRPTQYAFSFFGIVDLLGVIPTYLSLLVPRSHYLAAIRFLRVLRTFRVLKLSSYEKESQLLFRALKASHRRITVFLFTVLTLVVVLGSMMYMIEGEENGKKVKVAYDLFDQYDKATDTISMARTTGYTATAVADLMLKGQFRKPGICPPEYVGAENGLLKSVFSYLKERGVIYRMSELSR